MHLELTPRLSQQRPLLDVIESQRHRSHRGPGDAEDRDPEPDLIAKAAATYPTTVSKLPDASPESP